MRTKISIITVAYNSAETIRKTIESVLDQTYAPMEYIIMDGGSKDSTVQVASEYKEIFKQKGIHYVIVSEEDNGIYDAMNKGIKLATGELIGMINSDDWYEKNALQIVSETFEKTTFDAMYADLNLVKANGTVIVKRARLRNYVTSRDWNHPTMFVKKEIYNQLQYDINNVIAADFDMLMRIRKKGYKLVVVNQVLANFRTGGVSNEKSFKGLLNRIKCRFSCYRNNGYSRLYLIECVAMEVAKFILA